MTLDPASFYVVETADGNAYLGRLQQDRNSLTIRNGFVGRPVVLDLQEVDDIVLADEHPAVVQVA